MVRVSGLDGRVRCDSMKYAFVIVVVLAVWVGTILLAVCRPEIGIFLPVFAIVMTVILFLIGFGKRK